MSQDWEPPGQQQPPSSDQPAWETPQPAQSPQHGQYGQPPGQAGQYGQPGQPGTSPYPSAPSYPPPFASNYPQSVPSGPVSGGTTIAAAVIQIVHAAIWVVFGVILIVLSRSPEDIFDDSDFDQDFTVDDAKAVLVLLGALFLLVSLTMVVLGILLLHRSNGIRITSAVMQIVLGSISLIALLGSLGDGDPAGIVVALLNAAACAAVAVLLFQKSSVQYGRSGKAAGFLPPSGYPPPGYQPPGY